MVKEIEADAKQFGDARRTLIQERDARRSPRCKVIDEPVTVVVSLKGWVRALKGHEIDAATLAFKAGDGLYGSFPCRIVDSLIVFGSNGRVYSTAVARPARRARRRPADHHADRAGDRHPAFALLRRQRRRRRCCWPAPAASACWRAWATWSRGRRAARASSASSRPRSRCRPRPADGATQVACLSLAGRLLTFGIDELKLQPNGGRGLTLMDLDAKDALVSVAAFTQSLQVLGMALRGGKPSDGDAQGRRR